MRPRIGTVITGICCAASAAAGHAQTAAVPAAAQAGSHRADEHATHVAGVAVADPATAALTDTVRRATVHLRSRDAAIRAGYRRVGIDFPAMGEHWVNPGVLLRSGLDFTKPAILTYTQINGAPTLTGVVFAVSLNPAETPPLVAGSERPWHEHNGSIADEILPRAHVHGTAATGRRLAVLHLWTEVPNPAGPFATDNWALPFVRLGLAVPDALLPDAARALSLVSGGERYFLEQLELNGDSRARARADTAFAATRVKVAAIIEPIAHERILDQAALRDLGFVWQRLVQELSDICGVCAASL